MSTDLPDTTARGLLALGLLADQDDAFSQLATAIRADEEVHFTPGAVVAGRFRITAMVGRGGMGDVYRADDLKLGQPVALKFLPASSGGDAGLVRSFYDEVRVGRQVAHPNVCRIYDLLDVEGRLAIVMEFVEGEDLASLLERVGRLPYFRAVEIARDVCAGVDAAHEKRIIHGDLKPGNIMIDGRGRARITDFGLARLADDQGDAVRLAGTIPYMAPEQFTSRAPSERADLYSLGLVLYEIFTGTRTPAPPPPPPSLQQPSLEPQLETAILRCLRANPQERPASAREILAAFPPGDILDSVLAAGETPPSEFVAESRKVRDLRPGQARAVAAAAIVMLIIVAVLGQRLTLYGRSALALSPDILRLRARTMAAQLTGIRATTDETSWFETDLTARRILFHYRSSRSPLVPVTPDHHIHANEPPLDRGMVHIVLDTTGRLRLLRAVLPESETALAQGFGSWPMLFDAAQVDERRLGQTDSSWIPPVAYDEKREWTDREATVRASRYRGRVTYFEVAARTVTAPSRTMRESRLPYVVYFGVLLLSFVAGGYLARLNIRRRRVDARAAWRIGLWVLVCRALYGLIAAHHPLSLEAELALFASIAGTSLLLAAQVWLGYVALEPYARRRWPEAMIGWARVVHGRFLDRIVARDLLLGILAGLTIRLVDQIRNVFAWTSSAEAVPSHLAVEALISMRETVGNLFLFQGRAIFFALFGLFVLVLFQIALRRRWAAAAAWLVIITMAWIRWDDPLVDVPVVAAQMAILLLILHRAGLLAMAVTIFVWLVTVYTPLTAELRAFYFGQSALAFALIAALIGFGLRNAGGRALIRPPGTFSR